MPTPDPLAQPLSLPCGATLVNRLCKAAMTEGLADTHLRALSDMSGFTGRGARVALVC